MQKKKNGYGDLVPKIQHDAQPNVLERSRHQQLAIRGEAVTSRPRNHLGDLYAESGQTLQGSFSAVSKPNLQVNMRWKALAEIYTMHSFAPFPMLKIFVKNR